MVSYKKLLQCLTSPRRCIKTHQTCITNKLKNCHRHIHACNTVFKYMVQKDALSHPTVQPITKLKPKKLRSIVVSPHRFHCHLLKKWKLNWNSKLTTHCLIHGKGRVMHLKQPKNRPMSIFWSKCNHVKPIFFPAQQENASPNGMGKCATFAWENKRLRYEQILHLICDMTWVSHDAKWMICRQRHMETPRLAANFSQQRLKAMPTLPRKHSNSKWLICAAGTLWSRASTCKIL